MNDYVICHHETNAFSRTVLKKKYSLGIEGDFSGDKAALSCMAAFAYCSELEWAYSSAQAIFTGFKY